MPSHGTHDYHGKNFSMKKCLDCPAAIPAYGKKLRCAPCADAYYDVAKSMRAKERRARAKAAKGTE